MLYAVAMLREYQAQMVEQAREEYKRGHRRILFVAPTGAGKTHVLAANIESVVERTGGVVVYVAHRRQLVEQTHSLLTRLGIDATIMMAGHETDYSAKVFVASRDTLWRRRKHVDLGKPTLVIFDEAHIGIDAQRRITEMLEPHIVFGYTATPITLSGLQPGDFYTTMVRGPSYRELIAMGHLVPGIYYCAKPIDTSTLRVSKTTNDYVLEDVVNLVRGQVIGNLYEAIMVTAEGKKSVVFLPSVDVAYQVASELGDKGIPAATIDWSTPHGIRRRILQDFHVGKLRVLCNVDVFSEGWDEPTVEAVILASPTRSTARYIQRVGRGMRPSPGKVGVMVVDLANQVAEHGMVEDYEDWPLLRGKGVQPKNVIPQMRIPKAALCPQCHTYYSKSNKCPQCGWQPAAKYGFGQIEEVPGVIVPHNATPSRNIDEKKRFFQELLGMAQQKGWRRGFAYHAYKFRWREEPIREWWFEKPVEPLARTKKWVFWYIGYRGGKHGKTS